MMTIDEISQEVEKHSKMKHKFCKIFDACFYINLDSRPDRNKMALEQFKKLDIEPVRIRGVPFKGHYSVSLSPREKRQADGIMGCMLSHLSVLHWARKNNASVLIFEDDVKFINDYEYVIGKAVDELPRDWDMFYLGGNICNTITQVTDHVGRLSHAQSTHAYGVNRYFVEQLINSVDTSQVIPLDLTYAHKIIPANKCYITIPMVAVQQASYSDIEGTDVEYESWMEARFYQHLKRKIV